MKDHFYILAILSGLFCDLALSQHVQIMNECKARRGSAYIVNYSGKMAQNALPNVELQHPLISSSLDVAGMVARRLNTSLNHPRFPNLRGFIKNATWERSAKNVWDIRNSTLCLKELNQLGVTYQKTMSCSPIPAPVKVLNRSTINGVKFTRPGDEEYLIFSCEFVVRMYEMADVFKQHDINEVLVMGHHRKGTLLHDPQGVNCGGVRPSASMHRAGLAIDILGFRLNDGTQLNVTRDFYQDLDEFNELDNETCSRKISGGARAKKLRKIVCDLHATARYSTILTPNYNCGHYDHFHIDIRPRDNRRFLK